MAQYSVLKLIRSILANLCLVWSGESALTIEVLKLLRQWQKPAGAGRSPTGRASNYTGLERSRPTIDSESGRVAFQRRLGAVFCSVERRGAARVCMVLGV